MFPGLGGMNPAQMQKIMKQMGIKTEELNAKRIIIEGEDKNLIIENPQITKMTIQGQETYQIVGVTKEESKISEEDIKLVMEQAKVDKEKAKEALEKTKGDIAEAIMNLTN